MGNRSISVTSYKYDAGGFLSETLDPDGVVTTYANDWLGRPWREVLGSLLGAGEMPAWYNEVTTFSYDGLNRQTTVTTINVSPLPSDKPGGGQQPSTTMYVYGASGGRGSEINSNDLLWKIEYPGGATQEDDYDALGDVIKQTNRDNTVHTYQYDAVGRQTLDTVNRVTAQKAGLDTSVVALGTQYDTLGRVTLATSYSISGSVVNQVQNVYDGLGNLVTQYQANSGPVVTTSTPAVHYHYTTLYATAGNYSRLTGLTYPGGTQITYAYAAGLDNSISRITFVVDGSQTVETYRYLGLSTVIGATLPGPNINETVSLDNFGDVAGVTWTQGGTLDDNTVIGGTPLVDIAYGYTAAGQINGARTSWPTPPARAWTNSTCTPPSPTA